MLGLVSGWASAAGGFSSKSKARKDQRDPEAQPWYIGVAVKLAPAAFVILYFVGLTLFTNLVLAKAGLTQAAWWEHSHLLNTAPLWANGVLAATFILLSLFSARYININFFSLGGMYRNRLIRAYLGASNPKRNASLFTGFAENDNLRMREIDPALKPFHVLNLTLNLVAGERLAWQQRKAASFTVSPLHSGSSDLGYRSSAEYSDGITLGSALAISGAAASPNMGYHSSPVVGFIMTLCNARLGAWLGNPGVPGAKTWRFRGPRSAVGSLIKEAFGLTTNRSEYVYLSDGGHFENLGLYEMVARRCKYILVLDSGADPCFGYEDLGNALRKIRIDMNIPIEFSEGLAGPLRAGTKRCAVAVIDYSTVDGDCDPGYLVYVKPIFLGNEPPDVQSYHTSHELFPHEGTADQWFNESQTESYRMLGLHTMDEICRSLDGPGLDNLRKAAENYIQSGPSHRSAAKLGTTGLRRRAQRGCMRSTKSRIASITALRLVQMNPVAAILDDKMQASLGATGDGIALHQLFRCGMGSREDRHRNLANIAQCDGLFRTLGERLEVFRHTEEGLRLTPVGLHHWPHLGGHLLYFADQS